MTSHNLKMAAVQFLFNKLLHKHSAIMLIIGLSTFLEDEDEKLRGIGQIQNICVKGIPTLLNLLMKPRIFFQVF